MPDHDSYTNGAPIVKIDGDAIKRLRESQGLTQLYVATAIGVTTDTISRWENRRYPTIKKENAVKLAEALEVGLEAILDRSAPAPEQEPDTGPVPPESAGLPVGEPQEKPPFRTRLAGLLLAAALLVGLGWWLARQEPPPEITLHRWLPPHVPPGQTFPVLIDFSSSGEASFILKENLPPGCRALSGLPPFTAVGQEQGVIKWIRKTGPERLGFAYVAQAAPALEEGRLLTFSGSALLRQGHGESMPVAGADHLQVMPYHWADGNRDGRIDDEEILMVYDLFSSLEDLDFGQEQIEDIWAGSGYRWDPETRRYLVIP